MLFLWCSLLQTLSSQSCGKLFTGFCLLQMFSSQSHVYPCISDCTQIRTTCAVYGACCVQEFSLSRLCTHNIQLFECTKVNTTRTWCGTRSTNPTATVVTNISYLHCIWTMMWCFMQGGDPAKANIRQAQSDKELFFWCGIRRCNVTIKSSKRSVLCLEVCFKDVLVWGIYQSDEIFFLRCTFNGFLVSTNHQSNWCFSADSTRRTFAKLSKLHRWKRYVEKISAVLQGQPGFWSYNAETILWNRALFCRVNQANFFKDRHYLDKEWDVLRSGPLKVSPYRHECNLGVIA